MAKTNKHDQELLTDKLKMNGDLQIKTSRISSLGAVIWRKRRISSILRGQMITPQMLQEYQEDPVKLHSPS